MAISDYWQTAASIFVTPGLTADHIMRVPWRFYLRFTIHS
jgi:hypothetical protein